MQERSSGRSQSGTSTIPIKKNCAQFVLKFLDSSGKRWLLNMETVCGPCKVQLLSQYNEAAKVSKFH